MSIRAIAVGCCFGVVFAGAGMYVGQKTSVVDGGNIPAAILAFGVLSFVLRRRPAIDEGNIVQTVSSSAAVMSITGGLIGPAAALSLAGDPPAMPYLILWGIAVGVVGTLMAVPLRTAFITRGTLPFPSGAATAAVLGNIYRDARSAASHVRPLAIGGLSSFGFGIARSWFGWIPEDKILPFTVGGIRPEAIGLGFVFSPLLLAAGFLSGARIALSLVAGSVIAWLVIAPRLVDAGIATPDHDSLLTWLMWSGTGLMLGGTVAGVINVWRGMRAGLRDVKTADGFRMTRGHALQLGLAAIAVVVLGTVAFDVNPVVSIVGLALSATLCAAAVRAGGETDQTPAGPLGGFAQLVVGAATPGGIHAPLCGGGIVNGTVMHASMMLQNWKTGALVDTPPRTQLVAQLIGVVVGAVACAGTYVLIDRAYGLGSPGMPAPAAMSWRATAEVVQHGISAMPAYAPLAAALGFVTSIVLSLGPIQKYAPSPVAMGLAFILPPELSFTIALGGVLHWVVSRRSKELVAETAFPIASGCISGEAIAGLLIAVLIVAGIGPHR